MKNRKWLSLILAIALLVTAGSIMVEAMGPGGFGRQLNLNDEEFRQYREDHINEMVEEGLLTAEEAEAMLERMEDGPWGFFDDEEFLQQQEERLQKLVEDGRLTEEEAAEMLERMTDGPLNGGFFGRGRMGRGMMSGRWQRGFAGMGRGMWEDCPLFDDGE